MPQRTVVELAKELGLRAGELMFLAEHAGIRIPRMASTISAVQADQLREWAAAYTVTSGHGRQVVRPRAGADGVSAQVKQRLLGEALKTTFVENEDEDDHD